MPGARRRPAPSGLGEGVRPPGGGAALVGEGLSQECNIYKHFSDWFKNLDTGSGWYLITDKWRHCCHGN